MYGIVIAFTVYRIISKSTVNYVITISGTNLVISLARKYRISVFRSANNIITFCSRAVTTSAGYTASY